MNKYEIGNIIEGIGKIENLYYDTLQERWCYVIDESLLYENELDHYLETKNQKDSK